jgi:hypothetical protein
MTNRDRIHGTSDFVRGGVDEFGTERCRCIVGVGFWGQELFERQSLRSVGLSVSTWWLHVRR